MNLNNNFQLLQQGSQWKLGRGGKIEKPVSAEKSGVNPPVAEDDTKTRLMNLSVEEVIDKFTQGNLTKDEMILWLKSNNYPYSCTESKYLLTFNFEVNKKQYTISCSLDAAEKSDDDKTQTTYSYEQLQQYGLDNNDISTYFVAAISTDFGSVETKYALNPESGFNDISELFAFIKEQQKTDELNKRIDRSVGADSFLEDQINYKINEYMQQLDSYDEDVKSKFNELAQELAAKYINGEIKTESEFDAQLAALFNKIQAEADAASKREELTAWVNELTDMLENYDDNVKEQFKSVVSDLQAKLNSGEIDEAAFRDGVLDAFGDAVGVKITPKKLVNNYETLLRTVAEGQYKESGAKGVFYQKDENGNKTFFVWDDINKEMMELEGVARVNYYGGCCDFNGNEICPDGWDKVNAFSNDLKQTDTEGVFVDKDGNECTCRNTPLSQIIGDVNAYINAIKEDGYKGTAANGVFYQEDENGNKTFYVWDEVSNPPQMKKLDGVARVNPYGFCYGFNGNEIYPDGWDKAQAFGHGLKQTDTEGVFVDKDNVERTHLNTKLSQIITNVKEYKNAIKNGGYKGTIAQGVFYQEKDGVKTFYVWDDINKEMMELDGVERVGYNGYCYDSNDNYIYPDGWDKARAFLNGLKQTDTEGVFVDKYYLFRTNTENHNIVRLTASETEKYNLAQDLVRAAQNVYAELYNALLVRADELGMNVTLDSENNTLSITFNYDGSEDQFVRTIKVTDEFLAAINN